MPTTPGRPTTWSGRCSPPSTSRSTSRGARPSPAISGTGCPPTTSPYDAVVATRWPSVSPGCSRRTPPSGRASSTTGRRAATPTATAVTSIPTSPGSRTCGAVPVGTSTRRARRTATPRRCDGSRRRPGRSTCPTGCRCSATPGCRSPRWPCSRRSGGTARSTCGCRTRRPTCGTPSTVRRARCRATRTGPPTRSVTRCSPPWAATDASSSGC